MKPIRTGLAVAITLSLFYSLCTIVWAAMPDRFIGFTNSLFHGLDFGRLLGSEPFAWSSFFYALTVFATWGFGFGSFFSWLHGLLQRD